MSACGCEGTEPAALADTLGTPRPQSTVPPPEGP
jgi:hypothetical protein